MLPPFYIKKGRHWTGVLTQYCKHFPNSALFCNPDSHMMTGTILKKVHCRNCQNVPSHLPMIACLKGVA